MCGKVDFPGAVKPMFVAGWLTGAHWLDSGGDGVLELVEGEHGERCRVPGLKPFCLAWFFRGVKPPANPGQGKGKGKSQYGGPSLRSG